MRVSSDAANVCQRCRRRGAARRAAASCRRAACGSSSRATSGGLIRAARRRTRRATTAGFALVAVAAGAVLLDERGLRPPPPALARRVRHGHRRLRLRGRGGLWARQNAWPASAPPVQDRLRRRPRSQRLTSICSCGSLYERTHVCPRESIRPRLSQTVPFLALSRHSLSMNVSPQPQSEQGDTRTAAASTGWPGGAARESSVRKAGQQHDSLLLPRAASTAYARHGRHASDRRSSARARQVARHPAQHEIAARKRVRLAERTHRDVLGGPVADPGKGQQRRDRRASVRRAARAMMPPLATARASERIVSARAGITPARSTSACIRAASASETAASRPAPPATGASRTARPCVPASVVAPRTEICWPRMARTASSKPSQAPGVRIPGCRASGPRSSGSSAQVSGDDRRDRRRDRTCRRTRSTIEQQGARDRETERRASSAVPDSWRRHVDDARAAPSTAIVRR